MHRINLLASEGSQWKRKMIVKLRVNPGNLEILQKLNYKKYPCFDVISVHSHRERIFPSAKAPKLVNERDFEMKQKNKIYLTFSFARIKLVMEADY